MIVTVSCRWRNEISVFSYANNHPFWIGLWVSYVDRILPESMAATSRETAFTPQNVVVNPHPNLYIVVNKKRNRTARHARNLHHSLRILTRRRDGRRGKGWMLGRNKAGFGKRFPKRAVNTKAADRRRCDSFSILSRRKPVFSCLPSDLGLWDSSQSPLFCLRSTTANGANRGESLREKYYGIGLRKNPANSAFSVR